MIVHTDFYTACDWYHVSKYFIAKNKASITTKLFIPYLSHKQQKV